MFSKSYSNSLIFQSYISLKVLYESSITEEETDDDGFVNACQILKEL